MFRVRTAALAAGVAALAIAAPAAARPTHVYAKAHAGNAEMQAQGTLCWDEARGVRAPSVPTAVYTPNVAAAAGAALATGFIQGLAQGRAQMKYLDVCMRQHGFAKLELTEAEAAEFNAIKDNAARQAWLDGFLAKDWTSRIEAGLKPAVPPFAPAKDEPYAVGGVRLDPSKLTVAAGPVPVNAPLLAGEAAHRRTGTLAKPYAIDSMGKTRIPDGAVYHQVLQGGQTYWCGRVENRGALTPWIGSNNCIASEFEGYNVSSGDRPWLATAQNNSGPPWMLPGEIAFVESDQDLVGPMQVSFQPVKFNKTSVAIAAVATRDDQKVEFWRGLVELDAQGRGALPFWGHRLQLRRTDKTLTAQFTPDGDGRDLDGKRPGETAKVAAN